MCSRDPFARKFRDSFARDVVSWFCGRGHPCGTTEWELPQAACSKDNAAKN